MSRILIETIVERARDVRRLEPSRDMLRGALIDITIDVALQMAEKSHAVDEQQYITPQARVRNARKLGADWRAVVKGVKTVFGDHPISGTHMYAILLAYYPILLERGARFDDALLPAADIQRLRMVPQRLARKAVTEIMTRNFQ